MNFLMPSICRFGSGLQMIVLATCSSPTICAACSKFAGVGKSWDSPPSIGGGRPDLVGGTPRGRLIPRPADGDLAVARFAGAAGRVELLQQLLLRRRADQSIADAAGQLGGCRPAARDHDRRWFVR